VTDWEMVFELQRVHNFKTYGGNGYTLEGKAAERLRELILYNDQAKDRIEELLAIKHDLNEQLIAARAELQLHEAMLRERS